MSNTQTCSSKQSVAASSLPVQSKFLTHDFNQTVDEKVISCLIE